MHSPPGGELAQVHHDVTAAVEGLHGCKRGEPLLQRALGWIFAIEQDGVGSPQDGKQLLVTGQEERGHRLEGRIDRAVRVVLTDGSFVEYLSKTCWDDEAGLVELIQHLGGIKTEVPDDEAGMVRLNQVATWASKPGRFIDWHVPQESFGIAEGRFE